MRGVVLITGASHGIGLATAEHLAEADYMVYATCRIPEKYGALWQLGQKKYNITILALDVNVDESVKRAVSTILKIEGTIDVVINNAGFGIYGPSEMHTIAEAERLFNTNVLGVMRVNQAVIPSMRSKRKGCIINIGSIAGAVPSKNLPVYAACKAALESLSASDAHSLSEWNIKVKLIQPGPVVTAFESRTRYGSRFSHMENPYNRVLEANREQWKTMMDDGQTSEDVAIVIRQAIESPERKFWHQTSNTVSDAIGKHFKDLSGNTRVPHARL